jgi:hypothetical protein
MTQTSDPNDRDDATDSTVDDLSAAAHLDAMLDDALMQSFPASDPVAVFIPAAPRRSATPEQRRPSRPNRTRRRPRLHTRGATTRRPWPRR